MTTPAALPNRKYAEPEEIPLSGCQFASSVATEVVVGKASLNNVDLLTMAAYEELPHGVPSTILAGSNNEDHVAALSELIEAEEFTGKESKCHSCRLHGSPDGVVSLSVLGLGAAHGVPSSSSYGHQKAGKAYAAILSKAKKAACIHLPRHLSLDHATSFFEQLWLQLTPDNRFLSESKKKKLPIVETLTVVAETDEHKEILDQAISRSRTCAHGVRLAQELVATPPNYCTPKGLADAARQVATEHGLETKILDVDECANLGMGSFLCVGKGSENPPCMIHLTYKPAGEAKRRVALVGKGITFDAGGYNLKVNAMIELMKFDMGGAAAVLGASKIIGQEKPENVEAHFIVAAAENLIDGKAYRPSDVLTAMNGKTIEVMNTDAEGRLALADALVYAESLGVDTIVDIATLTGAGMVGLGQQIAGVYSRDINLSSNIVAMGTATGENMWAMPFFEPYKKDLESKIADMKNVGGRYGGGITAALFLSEFVSTKVNWVHIDMAGPAWDFKENTATGFGARTLARIVMDEK